MSKTRTENTDNPVRVYQMNMQVMEKNGAGNRSRTCDPLITNQMLYQLSYAGNSFIVQRYFRSLSSVLGWRQR